MMEREFRRIRKAIQQQQAPGLSTATRYPAELRRRTMVYARQRLEAGQSLKSIARQLGLRPQLLHYWLGKSATVRFRPVKVARAMPSEATQSPRLVVVTPGGFRVEGLDVAGVAELLGALS